MYKTILLAICLFAGIYLYGQVNENGFVIRLNGNYNETTTSNMLQYVNVYNAVTKNGNVSLSTGYIIHQHWLFGLDFEYNHNKTTTEGMLLERSSSGANVFLEQGKVSLNMYGGIFYTSYYLPIYRNLYFTPGFYLSYGAIKGNYSGLTISASSYPTDSSWQLISSQDQSGTSLYSYGNKISSCYFYMQLSPELTWFFSKHFGLNIQMGGLGINVVDFDWSNSSKQINFNPSFWKLGILFKI